MFIELYTNFIAMHYKIFDSLKCLVSVQLQDTAKVQCLRVTGALQCVPQKRKPINQVNFSEN